jgi:hypothetical protein
MAYSKNDDVNRQLDIGLKKKHLSDAYGADFTHSSGLEPDVEMAWLESIEAFEEQFKKRETIQVWHFIGCPSYSKTDEMGDAELAVELSRLMGLMNANCVVLDTLCKVDDRELYRFITEDLFVYEMNNVRVAGMNTCFIYEEFHPNVEYDIRACFDVFWTTTMKKWKGFGGDGYDLLYVDINGFLGQDGRAVGAMAVRAKIYSFLDAFDFFEVRSNQIERLVINQDKTDAELHFNVVYDGCYDGCQERSSFNGKGFFRLKPSEYGGWGIYAIDMPGLVI